jgi:hypothetical protein
MLRVTKVSESSFTFYFLVVVVVVLLVVEVRIDVSQGFLVILTPPSTS